MIVACIHCNWLAWLFLPLAIWVLRKIKKNHKCPCTECHDHKKTVDEMDIETQERLGIREDVVRDEIERELNENQ